MNPELQLHHRRKFLQQASAGFGYLAFQSLLAQDNPLSPRPAHRSAPAKRIIFLNMEGGPSAQETFNPKPDLSLFKFARHGQSGLPISEHFPHVAKHADKLCVLNGMHSDSPDHINAFIQLHCGKSMGSRPSIGSWITYGLGSENQNLPGFVILNPSKNGAGSKLYSNAFLPGIYAGTPISRSLELSDSTNDRMDRDTQRVVLDRAQSRNRSLLQRHKQDQQLNGLLNSYELAFRMQSALPERLDVHREPRSILEAYGVGRHPTDDFARQCLAARRLAEDGVRFVELTHTTWDHHSGLAELLPQRCREVDRPIAALLDDLSRRGLLDDTLVLWGGEFGREKTAKHKNGGSGHNNKGYTMWMAGGGVKPGFAYGQTDDQGWEAVEGRIHTHDLHATLLHQLGLDHERLTYRYAGRDFRLTDVKGNVAHEVLAQSIARRSHDPT